jgi:hypothetical protein
VALVSPPLVNQVREDVASLPNLSDSARANLVETEVDIILARLHQLRGVQSGTS